MQLIVRGKIVGVCIGGGLLLDEIELWRNKKRLQWGEVWKLPEFGPFTLNTGGCGAMFLVHHEVLRLLGAREYHNTDLGTTVQFEWRMEEEPNTETRKEREQCGHAT